jgi:hypothetical protein
MEDLYLLEEWSKEVRFNNEGIQGKKQVWHDKHGKTKHGKTKHFVKCHYVVTQGSED